MAVSGILWLRPGCHKIQIFVSGFDYRYGQVSTPESPVKIARYVGLRQLLTCMRNWSLQLLFRATTLRKERA